MGDPYPPYPPYSAYGQNPGQPYGMPYPAQPTYGIPVSGVPASGVPVPVTAPYPVSDQVIAQIGEIQVTSTTVRTPAGEFPLRGSRWDVTDQWVAEQKTPTWAIVLAVVGFFCLTLFSLLFLLAKETVYRGTVQVRVSNGPYTYVSRIPVTNQALVPHIYQQVNYVRSLSLM
ncbi:MAG TPA: hypothetical protein VJT31_20990 [Rugosimonospora sp.]|nr:hypothetical protein [Rugosimonospora sp.]